MDTRHWVGYDWDGVLVQDIPGGKYNPRASGEPIPATWRRLEEDMRNGNRIKIFTARAASIHHHTVFDGTAEEYLACVVSHIQEICVEQVGVELEITAEKDYLMKYFYDDRAIQMERNTGRRIDGGR